MTRERTGNKVLIWCVVLAVLLLAFLVYFGFVAKSGNETIIEVMPQPEPLPDQSEVPEYP